MSCPESVGAPQPIKTTEMAKFLTKQLRKQKAVLSQREIASKLGYPKSNIISMFKSGEAKVPLEKVPALADALGVDVALLTRLALEQYWPGKFKSIGNVFDRIATENEFALLRLIRQRTGRADPKVYLDSRAPDAVGAGR
jgi:transcriptional regulator with XRE-family HTH domain